MVRNPWARGAMQMSASWQIGCVEDWREADGKPASLDKSGMGLPVPQPYLRGACGAGGIYTHIGLTAVDRWFESVGVPTDKAVKTDDRKFQRDCGTTQ